MITGFYIKKQFFKHKIIHYIRVVVMIILLSLISVFSFGQIDYYVIDSIIEINAKVIDLGSELNSLKCQVAQHGKVLTFFPEDINEYGFKDGRKFFSKIVQIDGKSERVFLQKLTSGTIGLYSLRMKRTTYFFVESQEQYLNELKKHDTIFGKKSFRKLLSSNMDDCPFYQEKVRRLTFNKHQLVNFITLFNNCDTINFPTRKLAFHTGFAYLNYQSLDVLLQGSPTSLKSETNKTLSIGVEFEQPILISRFSIFSGINYSISKVIYSRNIQAQETSIGVNSSWFSLPLGIRYHLNSITKSTYFQGGGIISRSIKNDNYLKTTVSFYDDFLVTEDNSPFLSDFMKGFFIGGGTKFELHKAKKIFFELRYIQEYGSGDFRQINRGGLFILSGIKF